MHGPKKLVVMLFIDKHLKYYFLLLFFLFKSNSCNVTRRKVITVTVEYEQKNPKVKHTEGTADEDFIIINRLRKKPSVLVPCSRHNIFATAACKREKKQKTQMNKK